MKFDSVILAGGQSLRMGQDKGLMPFMSPMQQSQAQPVSVPMVSLVANTLKQGSNLWVNTNRHIDEYEALGFCALKDLYHEDIGELAGPLLGILTGLQHTKTDWVLFSPCDTPNLPSNYSDLMTRHASVNMSYVNVAYDGERRQNLHLLIHRTLAEDLMMYLLAGGRKTYQWLDRVNAQNVDFSDFKEGFKNINSPADL